MKEPLVSVIIPFYNRFDLLEPTLLSLRKQDYKNFEVILVDDCSEERMDLQHTEKLIGDVAIVYRKLQKNSGPGMARSVGRPFASGKYIAYLDSDDLWKPEFLRETVRKLEENSSLSMVFTNVLIKQGEKEKQRLKIKEGVYDFYDLIFSKKTYWATGAVLWRKEVSLSPNWKPLRDHEDYVHDILSLKFNPTVYHIAVPLCIVNKNPHTGIKRSNKEMLKSFLVLIKDKTLKSQLKEKEEYEKFVSFLLWRLSKRKFSFREFNEFHRLYFNMLLTSKNKKEILAHFFKLVYNQRFFGLLSR